MANNTCEGSKDPAVQADPLDAHSPSKSKFAKREMLSAPSTVNARVFGNPRSAGLRKWTCANDVKAVSKDWRNSFNG